MALPPCFSTAALHSPRNQSGQESRMDGHRFDIIAKSVAGGLSRRSLLEDFLE